MIRIRATIRRLVQVEHCICFAIWRLTKKMIRSNPRLLFYEGDYIMSNMKKEKIVKSEILAAVREKGYADLNDVYAAVMETDASLSVITKMETSDKTTWQM